MFGLTLFPRVGKLLEIDKRAANGKKYEMFDNAMCCDTFHRFGSLGAVSQCSDCADK
jgi:hypothetical protein